MNILIFDTETIGQNSQDLINVGWKIIDLDIRTTKYKVLIERDYLITRFINNVDYCMNDAFVGATKYQKFLLALQQKTAKKRKLENVFTTLENDIKRQKVLFAYAYNCKFDIDKFEKNGYNISIPVFDIWGYAYDKIISTPEYKDYCLQNELLTATKQYIQGNVESVIKFLHNDKTLCEDHTALSDIQHETDILVECVKRGSDITREATKPKNIKSGMVMNECFKMPNGDTIEIQYTTKYQRNGITYYKA